MRTPTPFLDYTTRDYLGYREAMLRRLDIEMPEYTDRSESDAGITIIELLSYGLDVTSIYADHVANEAFLYTARQRENVLKLVSVLAYIPKTATNAVFKQVFQIRPIANDFIIPQGFVVRTVATAYDRSVIYETDAELVIPAGATGTEKDDAGNYLYTVNVSEGRTIKNDIIGSSNGVIDQMFRLSYYPVVANTVRIYVNEGYGFQEWEKVDTFLESTADSEVFTVTVEENGIGRVTFGNGRSGKIPEPFLNGIQAVYKQGGGVKGNVGANKIIEMESPLAGIVKTFNPDDALIQGKDDESIEEIKDNSLRLLRTNDRAVTKYDYEDVMMLYSGVAMLDALCYPNNDEGIVYVYVTYKGMPMNPTGTVDAITKMNTYLDARRIIGVPSQVKLALPQIINVYVHVIANSVFRNTDVQSLVHDRIVSFFELGNFDIGEPFIISQLIKNIQSLPQVFSVDMSGGENQGMNAPYSFATLGTLDLLVEGGK